jgi:SAM-dependent methyltransferase
VDQAELTYGKYCETLLSHLGATSVDSIDASSYEGATIVHDLNKPLPADLSEHFDSVIDFGTIEHVFDVPQVLRTYASLVRDGGIILIATQADGCCGHGFYQFSPELFYRFFATERGFETKCFRALRVVSTIMGLFAGPRLVEFPHRVSCNRKNLCHRHCHETRAACQVGQRAAI